MIFRLHWTPKVRNNKQFGGSRFIFTRNIAMQKSKVKSYKLLTLTQNVNAIQSHLWQIKRNTSVILIQSIPVFMITNLIKSYFTKIFGIFLSWMWAVLSLLCKKRSKILKKLLTGRWYPTTKSMFQLNCNSKTESVLIRRCNNLEFDFYLISSFVTFKS